MGYITVYPVEKIWDKRPENLREIQNNLGKTGEMIQMRKIWLNLGPLFYYII